MPSGVLRGLFVVGSTMLATNSACSLVHVLSSRADHYKRLIQKRLTDAEMLDIEKKVEARTPLWESTLENTVSIGINTMFGMLPPAYALLYVLGLTRRI